MSRAYYNEIDPYAAQWLRNLIAAGHIAPGDVDERSIEDVTAEDLKDYTQCHFFAGIGVWSYALRRAGWPDDRPVWTGSCPCQPFSDAGRGEGFSDKRHLWPTWFRLISQRRPVSVFGEQVASKDGLAWLDLVQADLQTAEYAVAAVDLCAAGVGAPHIRQRLFFVAEELADAYRNGSQRGVYRWQTPQWQMERGSAGCLRPTGGLADPISQRSDGRRIGRDSLAQNGWGEASLGPRDPERLKGLCQIGGMADATGKGWQELGREREQHEGFTQDCKPDTAGPTNGHWGAVDWLLCKDGRWRPVEPGTFPLVNGAPARVGRLRAYGNAINAAVATLFISAYLDKEQGGA